MHLVLALVAGLSWGAGNFTMGIAGRRASPRATVMVSFAAGLAGALVFLLVQMPELVASTFAWGALSGFCQGAGWLLFAKAMQTGRIAIVAPLAATTSTTLLFLIGLLTGENVTVLAFSGACLALLAIGLLSRPNTDDEERASAPNRSHLAVLAAAGAGTLFAAQFVSLDQAGDEQSSLVMVGARLAVLALIGLTLFKKAIPGHEYKASLRFAGVAGLVILGGDLAYLSALANGPLTTVSIIGGLHPLATILLARLVIKERIGAIHWAGIALAVTGTAMLAGA